METITIQNTELKRSSNNKPYLTLNTDKGTIGCWKPDLFPFLNGVSQANVEIERKGAYVNIVAVDTTPQLPNVPKFEEKESKVSNGNFMSSRDASIVAQVLVKAATEIVCAQKCQFADPEELGMTLCNTINELKGAYNYAYELLTE